MNRINSPEYQDLIQHYRNELDSLKTVLTDTVTESTHSCFLANGFNGKWESREMTSGAGDLKLLPNPARDQCTIQFGQKLEHEGKLMLMNSLCLILHVQPLAAGIDRAELDTKNLAEGVYLIQVRSDSVDWRSPLMISR